MTILAKVTPEALLGRQPSGTAPILTGTKAATSNL